MHALHREREGHLFLGLQFPPCCWVRALVDNQTWGAWQNYDRLKAANSALAVHFEEKTLSLYKCPYNHLFTAEISPSDRYGRINRTDGSSPSLGPTYPAPASSTLFSQRIFCLLACVCLLLCSCCNRDL